MSTAAHSTLPGWQFDANDRPLTRLAPKGPWIINTGHRRAPVHLIATAMAAWQDDRPYACVTAKCGVAVPGKPAFLLDPGDRKLCDHCLLAGDMPHVVYTATDATSSILYIGYSGNLIKRLGQHRCSSPWWPLMRSLTYVIHENELAARTAERAEQKYHRPPFNIVRGVA